jgi:AraC-like DNA-binding protein
MTAVSNDDSERFITASLLQHGLEAIRKRGIEPGVVSQMLGIDLEAYAADPEGWVPVRVYEELLRKSQALRPNPSAGLRAAASNSAAFGALGYLSQTCATLEDIFTATARYERLVSDIGLTSLRHEPGIVLCCWQCTADDELFRRIATDFIIGSWMHHLRMVKDSSLQLLLAVHFRHQAPEDPTVLQEYEQYFGCPVKFDQPESALVVPLQAMRARLRNPSPSLNATLERHLRLMLAERNPTQSVVDKTRVKLRMMLQQGNLSRDQLAGELGLSARQLHRQLQKAGSSYSDLVDDLRLELAKTLLQDPTLTIEVIARRLNFTESPSFVRWFRHKVGQTPGEYRHALAMSGR